MDTFKKQEALKKYFDHCHGFAVFSSIAKAGIFFVGAAGGKGDVYKKEGDKETLVGHVDMLQANLGFTLGGQVYQEIIFFESEKDFDNFTSGNFEFSADANVVALTASVSTKATTMGNQGITGGLTADDTTIGAADIPQYTKGMAVFTVALGGLMYQATVSGQKFTYTPLAA